MIMQGFLSGSEHDHWQPAQVGCPALSLPHHPISAEGHGPASCQGCCPHAPTSAAQTASCLAGRAVMTTLEYSTLLHHTKSHDVTLQYIALHYMTLCCIALHYIALHMALHCIALHHITPHHTTSPLLMVVAAMSERHRSLL